jgi:hypothetical protein
MPSSAENTTLHKLFWVVFSSTLKIPRGQFLNLTDLQYIFLRKLRSSQTFLVSSWQIVIPIPMYFISRKTRMNQNDKQRKKNMNTSVTSKQLLRIQLTGRLETLAICGKCKICSFNTSIFIQLINSIVRIIIVVFFVIHLGKWWHTPNFWSRAGRRTRHVPSFLVDKTTLMGVW